MKSPQIAGKKLVFAPVLRAGVTFAEGMLDLVPTARIAHIGLYREPETFTAVEYFFKAPSDLHERLVIVISPVLATANSAVAAVDRLKERGANDIRLVCLIGAPEGVERMRGIHPDVPIWLAAIDQGLDEQRLHRAGSRRRRRPRLRHEVGPRLIQLQHGISERAPALPAAPRDDTPPIARRRPTAAPALRSGSGRTRRGSGCGSGSRSAD